MLTTNPRLQALIWPPEISYDDLRRGRGREYAVSAHWKSQPRDLLGRWIDVLDLSDDTGEMSLVRRDLDRAMAAERAERWSSPRVDALSEMQSAVAGAMDHVQMRQDALATGDPLELRELSTAGSPRLLVAYDRSREPVAALYYRMGASSERDDLEERVTVLDHVGSVQPGAGLGLLKRAVEDVARRGEAIVGHPTTEAARLYERFGVDTTGGSVRIDAEDVQALLDRLLERGFFDPSQPRVPRGLPGGGRWTSLLSGSFAFMVGHEGMRPRDRYEATARAARVAELHNGHARRVPNGILVHFPGGSKDALDAAERAQTITGGRLRVGISNGVAEVAEGEAIGTAINHAARIAYSGRPGDVRMQAADLPEGREAVEALRLRLKGIGEQEVAIVRKGEGGRPDETRDRRTAGLYRHVSFADLANFSGLAETLGSEGVAGIIADFKRKVLSAYEKNGGKPMHVSTGDGAVAMFDDATAALSAAHAASHVADDLGFQVRAGVATGRARPDADPLSGELYDALLLAEQADEVQRDAAPGAHAIDATTWSFLPAAVRSMYHDRDGDGIYRPTAELLLSDRGYADTSLPPGTVSVVVTRIVPEERKLAGLLVRAHFDPRQPRHVKGTAVGGRWKKIDVLGAVEKAADRIGDFRSGTVVRHRENGKLGEVLKEPRPLKSKGGVLHARVSWEGGGVAEVPIGSLDVRGADGKLPGGLGRKAKVAPTPDADGWHDVGADVELAALLLGDGKKVRLEQPDQVCVLLDRLAANVLEATEKGEKAPTYDLCNVTVSGTNLFCVESKGIPRIEMPQLKAKPLPGSKAAKKEANAKGEVDLEQEFLTHLKGMKVGIAEDTMPASHARATQNELNGGKVSGMVKALRAGALPSARLFVSRENYILDGHHRWAALVGFDSEDGNLTDIELDVNRIDLSIIELLAEANRFAKEWGIPQSGPGGHVTGFAERDCGCA